MSAEKLHIPSIDLPEHAPLGLEEAYILGYNVERLRTKERMDITKFAQVSGITRPTIYKIESGEADPRLSYIRKLADALGVTVVDLLMPPFDAVDSSYYRESCQMRTKDRQDKTTGLHRKLQ